MRRPAHSAAAAFVVADSMAAASTVAVSVMAASVVVALDGEPRWLLVSDWVWRLVTPTTRTQAMVTAACGPAGSGRHTAGACGGSTSAAMATGKQARNLG